MKCTTCGRKINNNAKYCKYCGAQLKIFKSEKEGLLIKCSSCGATVKQGTLFCTQCGKQLNIKQKDKKIGKIRGILISVLLGIVCIGLLSAYLIFDLQLLGQKPLNNPIEEKTDVIQTEDSDQKKGKNFDESDNEKSPKADTSSPTVSQEDDVEADIIKINDDKTEIDKNIRTGIYDSQVSEEGVIFYKENSIPTAILVPKEYKNDGYQRSYYFVENKLIFAEYIGDDQHQFFYKDDQLLKWRYSSDTTKESTTIDYDQEKTGPYLQWQQRILDESYELIHCMMEIDKTTDTEKPDVLIEVSSEKKPFYGIWIAAYKDENEAKTFVKEAIENGTDAQLFITTDWDDLNSEKWYVVSAGVYIDKTNADKALKDIQRTYPDAYVKYSGANRDEYILPDSNKRYISPSDLKHLSKDEVRVAINELYARHGRKFVDRNIQLFFESKSWYKPTIEPDGFTEDVFNDFELKNKETLVEWEESHGWREKKSSDPLQ